MKRIAVIIAVALCGCAGVPPEIKLPPTTELHRRTGIAAAVTPAIIRTNHIELGISNSCKTLEAAPTPSGPWMTIATNPNPPSVTWMWTAYFHTTNNAYYFRGKK